jgi:hypothetical protein
MCAESSNNDMDSQSGPFCYQILKNVDPAMYVRRIGKASRSQSEVIDASSDVNNERFNVPDKTESVRCGQEKKATRKQTYVLIKSMDSVCRLGRG